MIISNIYDWEVDLGKPLHIRLQVESMHLSPDKYHLWNQSLSVVKLLVQYYNVIPIEIIALVTDVPLWHYE